MLGLAFLRSMRERYPEVRLHMVESLSGHLATTLNARQIDLAILFRSGTAMRFSVMPLLDERRYAIAAQDFSGMPQTELAKLAQLADLPLILPIRPHGLRSLLDAAFAQVECVPNGIDAVNAVYECAVA
jgi:LysR family transcriptional regulator, regulatory protein for tcuABC